MLEHFFMMGGYAKYIWPAVSISLVLLALNIWWPMRCSKRLLQDLAAREEGINE